MTARLEAHIKTWTWNNYLSARALSQADNVCTQRITEQNDLDICPYDRIKQAPRLVLLVHVGFFMQVAHKERVKGLYVTAKDN